MRELNTGRVPTRQRSFRNQRSHTKAGAVVVDDRKSELAGLIDSETAAAAEAANSAPYPAST